VKALFDETGPSPVVGLKQSFMLEGFFIVMIKARASDALLGQD